MENFQAPPMLMTDPFAPTPSYRWLWVVAVIALLILVLLLIHHRRKKAKKQERVEFAG
jgi:cytochrome c-type biogenesis protein CcmH/NrfF